MSIAVKMIAVSTVLLVVVIGLFGVLSRMQVKRLIDDSSKRLEAKISENLRRAGTAQLQLLAQTTRIAVVQSDYSTLQTVVHQMATQDNLVTEVGVVDKATTVLAHAEPKMVAKKATAALKDAADAQRVVVTPEVAIKGKPSMAFAMPVMHEGAKLCSVFLSYSLEPLKEELKKAGALKARELGSSLRNVLVVGLLSVLLGVLLTIVQSLGITRPIKALADKASQIAGGDLDARVDVKSGDEIGQLGDRFNYMADQVVALMQEAMKKVVMEKELEVVSAVQATLVPDASVVQLGGISLAGYFRPATQCGGDWWNYYRLAQGKVMVIIGDVTGHGAASAMITAAAKGAATTITDVTDGKVDLTLMLRAMNTAINDAAKGRFVMTCFAAIYDERTHTLAYANAGHNFPYMCDAKGKITPLVARGNRLGDVVGSKFEIRETKIAPGTMIVFYTDGIVEGENESGEEYGERRFRNRIKEYMKLDPDRARDEIVARASEFYGNMPPADDITLIVGKFS